MFLFAFFTFKIYFVKKKLSCKPQYLYYYEELHAFSLHEKCPNTELFLVRIFYFPVFRLNTGKYGPKARYLDTFHAVFYSDDFFLRGKKSHYSAVMIIINYLSLGHAQENNGITILCLV